MNRVNGLINLSEFEVKTYCIFNVHRLIKIKKMSMINCNEHYKYQKQDCIERNQIFKEPSISYKFNIWHIKISIKLLTYRNRNASFNKAIFDTSLVRCQKSGWKFRVFWIPLIFVLQHLSIIGESNPELVTKTLISIYLRQLG